MSSYAALLEEYYEENRYANDTFTDIETFMESVGDIVNENVDFNITLSLNEVSLKDAGANAKKIGQKIGEAISRLVQKITDFVKNIAVAIRRVTDKAKVIVATNGNKVLSNALKDKESKLGKDITLKVAKGGPNSIIDIAKIANEAIETAYRNLDKCFGNVDALGSGAHTYDTHGPSQKAMQSNIESIDADYSKKVEEVKETLSKSYAKSDAVENFVHNEGQKIKDVYGHSIKPYIDLVDPNGSKSITKEALKTVDTASKKSNEAIKKLRKIQKDLEKDSYSAGAAQDLLSKISRITTDIMSINHSLVAFALSVLSLATKNSTIVALAAVGADGKRLAGQAKGKVNATKSKIDKKRAAKKNSKEEESSEEEEA